jgi:hypothetical protein
MDNNFFSSYNDSTSTPLPDLLLQLLENQKRLWPAASEGYSSLQHIQIREIKCNTFSVWLQFNPKRIVSTGANVDVHSISQRRCFLCVENLPAEQQGVLYRNKLLALCNPMPIFSAHFTISHLRHVPQSLDPFLETFLQLARDLSPQFTVFYNGAQCGASAPDHFHFQASPAGKIPIEREAAEASRRELLKMMEGVAIWWLKNLGRSVIVFEGTQAESMVKVLRRQLAKMKNVLGVFDEPKVNMLCHYQEPQWRVILFPRRQHRPQVFFKEGDEKVLISPAAVDMGGLIVTPIEKDFKTVEATMIEEIYREVSWDEAMARKMVLD